MKTKKLLAVVLAVMMLICAMPLAVSAEDTAPATTIINDATYYQIGTAEELVWFANQVNAGQESLNAILTADIDLAEVEWIPIGSNTSLDIVFSGIFDGDGYIVKGLKYSGTNSFAGLFGYVKDGGIKNLTVSGEILVTSKGGFIAGQIADSIIYNCKAIGKISRGTASYCYAGGVVGVATHSVIINCVAQTDITVNFDTSNIFYAAVGGIAGVANAGNEVPQCILNSYCVGNITVGGTKYMSGSMGGSTPKFYVGGIAGYLADDAVNNYYFGEIVNKDEGDLRKQIGYAFGYVNPEIVANDGTSHKTIIKNNYYPAGKNAIGASAKYTDDASAWATGIDMNNDFVDLLNANTEEVAQIITTHRSFLEESTWSDIVERVDGEAVAVSEWEKGSDGLPALTAIESENADTPGDGEECNHMCHKKGFMGFIWKLVRFFQKSFKRNQYCDCGVVHY